jgi:hypothetical protein
MGRVAGARLATPLSPARPLALGAHHLSLQPETPTLTSWATLDPPLVLLLWFRLAEAAPCCGRGRETLGAPLYSARCMHRRCRGAVHKA